MKKFATTVLVIILSVAMIVPQAGVAYASTRSNAEKVLKYYKQGNINKALSILNQYLVHPFKSLGLISN